MTREELLSKNPTRKYRNTLDRFWLLVEKKGPDGCWIWKGGKSKEGYGQYSFKGICFWSHRLSYILEHGYIDDKLTIDHLCRNPTCVNPKHLEMVTIVENFMRGNGWGAVNARKTHCKRGHIYSEENTYRYPRENANGIVHRSRQCRSCDRIRDGIRRVKARAALRELEGEVKV